MCYVENQSTPNPHIEKNASPSKTLSPLQCSYPSEAKTTALSQPCKRLEALHALQTGAHPAAALPVSLHSFPRAHVRALCPTHQGTDLSASAVDIRHDVTTKRGKNTAAERIIRFAVNRANSHSSHAGSSKPQVQPAFASEAIALLCAASRTRKLTPLVMTL